MKEYGILTNGIVAAILMATATFSAQAQFKSGYAELEDSETISALREHISTISAASMEGRLAGSEGERATAEYVSDVLKEYGIDVLSGKDGEAFGIRQDNGDTLTSRNVVAFLQGSDPKLFKNYIVIGARMDNLGIGSMTVNGRKVEKNYYGANGNASGLAMMLELAKMLETNKLLLRRSVLFIGFGASCQTFSGSWYFLNRSFSDVANIDAMINLEMVGTGSLGFYAYTASNADLNQQLNAEASKLQPITPQIVGQEPYPSDHRSFYGKDIPSVYFTTGIYPEHDTERDTQSIIDYDTMERELEYVYNFTVSLANGPKPAFRPSEAKGSGRAIPYYDCDVKPTFFGHSDPRFFLTKWVYSYLKYPKEAVNQGIQGNVQVSFIIDEDGKVKDAKVVRSADPLLDAEAVKVISASPDWKPGMSGGKRVKSEMTLYVEFRLEKKGTFGIKKHEN